MRRRSVSSKNESENPNPCSETGAESPRLDGRNPNSGREKDKAELRSSIWSDRNVLLGCLVFRILNSLLVQTYFNPDEHWQALEVAHRVVFGYGHLTWEWNKGIRSYLHPMIFALLYKTLAIFNWDTPWFMMKAPRLLQSIFAAIGDLYLYKLARRFFGDRVSQCALFCQLTNWFMFFCITRTLSNSLETVLTTICLFYWPFDKFSLSEVSGSPMSRKLALLLAALSCAIRPTSAIVWLYVGIIHLYETHDKLNFLILEVLPIGIIVLIATCLLDWWLYGSWIFVPLNFLKFNFFSSGGDYYGTHPWHWYFTQGFPAMLFTFLPLSAVGIWLSKQWQLGGLIGWVLGLYSILGHKEFRFVLPLLPVSLMFAGYSLVEMERHAFSQRNLGTLEETKLKNLSCQKFFSWKYFIIICLIITNIPVALYMTLVHQRGSEAVMAFLAREADKGQVQSVTFLMPCHATPYYSSMHRNLPMRFLDCSPSDSDQEVIDESDRFMLDPASFVSDMFSSPHLPSHIVLFDSQERQLGEFLASHGYRQAQRFFHAHFPVDRELQGYVVIYVRLPSG